MSESKVMTNTVLKGLLTDALVMRTYCTDLDSDMQPGMYYTDLNTTGTKPTHMIGSNECMLIVLPKRFGIRMYQLLISYTGMFAIRSGSSVNMVWQPWREPVLHE